MTVVERFPNEIEEIENEWIAMPDGCRLAARIWLPREAREQPVPAILEYIPYRKRDFTRARDEPMHSYFAGHGYAALRVDLRGTGDSEGVIADEYSEVELADAEAVIAWIAAQPWCSGSVGMMGKSWGGFNALQVAARRPPALKAIITVCASDDRYSDDAHYMGGCLLNENLIWGSVLFTFNAKPPDPELVGPAWRELWRARLEQALPFPALWMEHQRRDHYWQHGSICEDFSRIECPVYAIGGWADGYSNAVPRLMAGLRSPRKGLIGPWAHLYPHDGIPGPAMGFLQEAIAWWDRWLKGVENGVMAEPSYRVWMQESIAPAGFYVERPGRWVAEETWPSPEIEEQRLFLNPGRLAENPEPEQALAKSSPQTTGLAAGDWCAFGTEGELPADQREDDGKSLVFDSEALPEAIEILGAARLRLELAVDRPVAQLAVRLNDVAPDGASTRVTYGLLNLTHRDSHESPSRLEPGRRYTVELAMNDIAQAFPAGHRLRVAVSTCYWPIMWPAPEPVTLTLYSGASQLFLPIRRAHPRDATLREFPPPERGPMLEHEPVHGAPFVRSIERDLTSGETLYTVHSDSGDFEGAALARIDAIDLEVGNVIERRMRIADGDPLSAQAEVRQQSLLRRAGWSVQIDTRTQLSASREAFLLEAELRALENGKLFFERQWHRRIERDHL